MISNSEDFVWYIPLKRVVDGISNGTTVRQVTYDTGVYVTRIESISSGSINIMRLGNVDYSLHLEGYRLNKGDILFSHINSLEKVGNTAIYKGEVPLYNGMNLLRIQPSNSTNSLWLYYVLRSHYFNSQVKKIANHAINQVSISTTNLKQLVIPYVKRKFQDKIAIFLEQKTSEIDTLIEDKEKLIALLEEKRQAIITEAVTKGLDPDVKMKDSGVKWIGEIPEHWGVEKYKNLVQRIKRSPKLHAEIITAFRDGIVTLRKNRREDGYTFALKEHGYQQIKEGDLVVHQMDAFAGAIGISDSEGKASPVYTVCIPLDKNIHMPYLSWSLKVMSMGGYIQALAKGIRERSTDFRWSDMKGLLTCLPPYREQVEIERYIETFIKDNTDLITKLKDAIKLLKEYRQALIYEAVTGKIDVQEMLKETEQEEVSSS